MRDVYKRQLVELNNKIVYRKSEKFRRIYKMAELFAKSDMAVMISVSYTHLDVYKRQA